MTLVSKCYFTTSSLNTKKWCCQCFVLLFKWINIIFCGGMAIDKYFID